MYKLNYSRKFLMKGSRKPKALGQQPSVCTPSMFCTIVAAGVAVHGQQLVQSQHATDAHIFSSSCAAAFLCATLPAPGHAAE
jgi:hypothetical protein